MPEFQALSEVWIDAFEMTNRYPVMNRIEASRKSLESQTAAETCITSPDSLFSPLDRGLSSEKLALLELSITPSPCSAGCYSNDNEVQILDRSEDAKQPPHQNSVATENNPPRKISNLLRSRLASLRRWILSSGPARSYSEVVDDAAAHKVKARSGWRVGIMFCCVAISVCLIAETVLLIWASVRSSGAKGSGLIYAGHCQRVRSMEVWLLLPLNIAATVIVGTSNYVMQIMSAPTREQIDTAHSFAKPIAVAGIKFNDMRNNHGGNLRRAIWWLLGLSSIPIHLLLNVSVYSSVQASNTGVLIVSDNFEDDPNWSDVCYRYSSGSFSGSFACSLWKSFVANQTQTMTRSQCFSQYTGGFQTNASSVIIVTSADSAPWQSLATTAMVPKNVSYGLPCQQISGQDKYTTIPTQERSYRFDYDEASGTASVHLDFYPFCANTTYRETKDGPEKWYIQTTADSLANRSIQTSGTLFLHANDTASKIPSIQSIFSAYEYRYWSVASMSGDYLRKDYVDLLANQDPRAWLCPSSELAQSHMCDLNTLRMNDNWQITPAKIPVERCYVLPKTERCTLRYSSQLLIITIVFDFVKLAAMLTALKTISDPLVTIGDVIESFLINPDPFTKDIGLVGDEDASKWTSETRQAITNPVKQYFQLAGFEFTTVWRQQDLPPASHPPSSFQLRAYEWLLHGGFWWTSVLPMSQSKVMVMQRRLWFAAPSKLRWLCFICL